MNITLSTRTSIAEELGEHQQSKNIDFKYAGHDTSGETEGRICAEYRTTCRHTYEAVRKTTIREDIRISLIESLRGSVEIYKLFNIGTTPASNRIPRTTLGYSRA